MCRAAVYIAQLDTHRIAIVIDQELGPLPVVHL